MRMRMRRRRRRWRKKKKKKKRRMRSRRKKKRRDWKSPNAHTFFRIMIIPKTYGVLRCRATAVPNMVKIITVYKSNANSEHNIFLD